jgi:DNA-binding PadR family transcriptional regulator
MLKHHIFAFFRGAHPDCAHKSFFGRGGGEFFDRFGGGPGGPGLRPGRLLSSEDLQLIILALISEKPAHGYEIIKEIERRSSGVYTPSPGVIYPALTYLEEASLAVSEAEGTKKRYRITEAGAESVAQNRQRTDEMLEKLARWGERIAHFRDQMAQEEEADERWAGSPRDQQRKEWREMREDFHDLRRELKAALFEKRSAPMEEKKRVLEVLRKAIAEIRQEKA